jgi:hypothetical protein
MGPIAASPSARAEPGPEPARRSGFPRRVAFLYVPNGVLMPDWTPAAAGQGFDLPFILEPLKAVREEVTVLSGLALDKARAGGMGNHARASAAFLTCARPNRTEGADLRAGVSADQVAAGRIGAETRFASLELGCEGTGGVCDVGYSCVYTETISWRTETSPLAKEIDPRAVFARLFGVPKAAKKPAIAGRKPAPDPDAARERRLRGAVLDAVKQDADDLAAKLGAEDRRKLDEYLTAVRDIERRLERFDADPATVPAAGQPPPPMPRNYAEHLRLMADMLVLAFRADLTRVATWMLANEHSNRPYGLIGVHDGHHDLSHHGNQPESKAKLRLINRLHVQHFAYLLDRLRSCREGEGTLLDNCLIAYRSGCSDGNTHDHADLPILLAGRGGGTVSPGRHIRLPKETPLANLWVSMLGRVGVPVRSFGDSTGPLPGLEG